MQINGSIVLVTGANRGLGRAFARGLLERGATTVYGGARDPGTIVDPGVIPVALDITDPMSVAAAVARCGDVTILVNNAGIGGGGALLGAPGTDGAREEMEVNYFGTLAMCRAFAPVLRRNGGGALVNMLSALSFFSLPDLGSYSASKSAAWSLTNGVRIELRSQGTQVVGIHAGFIDTDLTATLEVPKADPVDIVHKALDGVEAGWEEVLADDTSVAVKAALPHDLDHLYPGIQRQWDDAHREAFPASAAR